MKDFRRLAVNAGFCKDGPQHSLQAHQVDSTSAAIHTLIAQGPRLPVSIELSWFSLTHLNV